MNKIEDQFRCASRKCVLAGTAIENISVNALLVASWNRFARTFQIFFFQLCIRLTMLNYTICFRRPALRENCIINSKLTDFLPSRRRSKISSSKENTPKSSLRLCWYTAVKKIIFAVFTVAVAWIKKHVRSANILSSFFHGDGLFTFHNWSLLFLPCWTIQVFDPSFACCEATLRNAVLCGNF